MSSLYTVYRLYNNTWGDYVKTKLFFRITALVLVVIVLSVSLSVGTYAAKDNQNQSEWLSFRELCKQKGFVNGIQQPYMAHSSVGNDLGYSSLDGYTRCNFSEDTYMRVLANSKAMGYDIFKTWLNYNCAGMIFDSSYYVIGVDPTYLENLPKVIKMAQDLGLYLCFTTFDHKEGYNINDTTSYQYERVMKYLYNKKARDMVFENWLRPILEVLKQYPNVVLLDLYTEPEADGGKWNVPNNTNWDNMREFIKAENEFVKSIIPDMETYCSATVKPADIYEAYSGLDLDYYAYDLYQARGGSVETAELFLDAPFIFGEYGIKGARAKGDELVSNWLDNYYSECMASGVKAGFFWEYGFGDVNNMSAIDKNLRPRTAMLTSRFFQLDRDYELSGNHPEIDKPTMAYSTNESIVFMGSRGAAKYRIERTEDLKNWSEILTFDPEVDKVYEYGTLMYNLSDSTAVGGKIYYYRAVAIGYDGKTQAVSDPSNRVDCKRTVCDESENLIMNYSFEDESAVVTGGDGRDGKWAVTTQGGSNPAYQLNYIKDGVEGELTHSGTHSISKARKLKQYVSLKPNTDYTFTFFVKFNNVAGYWNHYAGLVVDAPKGNDYDLFTKTCAFDYIQIPDLLKDGEWHRMTYFFNSGDNTEVSVEVQGYHTKQDNPDWYVDDFYLFETE